MPLVQGRKRRAPPEEDQESSVEASPEPQTQRRRTQGNDVDDEDGAFAGDNGATQNGSHDELAKKLVRLALACEYGRRPIRRQDINDKVLGLSNGRAKLFKLVWDQAQYQLQTVFGMEMVELPAREKITLQQRRAAQKKDSQSQSKTTSAWILTNVLPTELRDPAILAPPSAPTTDIDAQYTAIYTLLVSLTLLSGGTLPDTKMDRYLRKLGIDDRTPVPGYEKIEQLMKRLEKDGYLYKLKESTGTGEDDTYYVVGPRGRVEIGEDGVRGLTRTVMPPADSDDEEDLDKKVIRSLGLAERADGQRQPQQNGGASKPGRKRKNNPAQEAEEDDDEDDDEDDEDDE
ncbi:Putative MAGE domain, melanoma-associated antigen, MAGE domain, winged helix WH1 [Septoria linicola]|uniref:MAGE domain, melanoma-associated antigen, MAGE domain, winged helix WH1 n=1 Tax=Septoria linicola TaxID=215465 RepID=A0A9Q9AEA9_9PEZI|nr:putative MAGE domain, melanoma-associated antigen, MAGE domain, winged helix WH1 [Septoria linicola]USW47407.1 Putative MAGE domain, melanoma-associated antigen, MAGE domain, winged helix WH1 [Septoria linicola]